MGDALHRLGGSVSWVIPQPGFPLHRIANCQLNNPAAAVALAQELDGQHRAPFDRVERHDRQGTAQTRDQLGQLDGGISEFNDAALT
jgi:hypothetical protein